MTEILQPDECLLLSQNWDVGTYRYLRHASKCTSIESENLLL